MGSIIGYQEVHGPVATFETDVAGKIRKLEASIEPVQDLHGYDHPWPAGGGVNLWNKGNISVLGTYQSVILDEPLSAGTYTFSTAFVTSGTKIPQIRLRDQDGNAISSHNLSNTTNNRRWCTFTTTEDVYRIYLYSAQGDSGVTAEYNDVQLEIGSTVTNYSPYSNICPIAGFSSAKITHHGKNRAQYWQQGYVGTDGAIKTVSSYAMAKPVFIQNGSTIAVSNTAGDYQGVAIFSDESLENMIYRVANTASTYTASQDCYAVCWFNKVYSAYTESDFINRGAQIEFNAFSTDFEPCSYNEYDITFPSEAGTVYGGTLDVANGELVVDRAMVDLGTLTWTYDQNVFRFSATLPLAPNITDDIRTRGICEIYKADQSVYSGSGRVFSAFCFGVTGVFVRDSRFDNVSDFKSAMSGVQLCYELATPITYQLTPHEINTIIGTNTIYADTGDTSVIYPKTITPVETVSNVSLMELRRGIIASQPHLETKSGEVLSFKSTMARKPESLVVGIEPIQEGTGDPSPDNVRPITGWTGAKATKCGKNLVPMTAVSRAHAGITYTVNDDGSVTIDGTATATSWLRGPTALSERQFMKAGTYHLSGTPASRPCVVYIIGAYLDGETLSNANVTGGVYDNGNGLTFTLLKDATVTYQIQVYKGTTINNLTIYPQIEFGSTATAYEPYVGSTYDITFPSEAGTVYGGTLDVVNGELVVDRAMVDLGTLTWSISGNRARFILSDATDPPTSNVTPTNILCSSMTFIKASTNLTEYGQIAYTRVREQNILIAWYGGVLPIGQLVYELATPITYQLTPQEVSTIIGTNIIYADTGDTTISYFTN